MPNCPFPLIPFVPCVQCTVYFICCLYIIYCLLVPSSKDCPEGRHSWSYWESLWTEHWPLSTTCMGCQRQPQGFPFEHSLYKHLECLSLEPDCLCPEFLNPYPCCGCCGCCGCPFGRRDCAWGQMCPPLNNMHSICSGRNCSYQCRHCLCKLIGFLFPMLPFLFRRVGLKQCCSICMQHWILSGAHLFQMPDFLFLVTRGRRMNGEARLAVSLIGTGC